MDGEVTLQLVKPGPPDVLPSCRYDPVCWRVWLTIDELDRYGVVGPAESRSAGIDGYPSREAAVEAALRICTAGAQTARVQGAGYRIYVLIQQVWSISREDSGGNYIEAENDGLLLPVSDHAQIDAAREARRAFIEGEVVVPNLNVLLSRVNGPYCGTGAQALFGEWTTGRPRIRGFDGYGS